MPAYSRGLPAVLAVTVVTVLSPLSWRLSDKSPFLLNTAVPLEELVPDEPVVDMLATPAPDTVPEIDTLWAGVDL